MRGFVRRFWRVIAGAAAVLVLAAGGGIQAYRTVGFGHGPLVIASVNSAGTVSRGHPIVVVIPIALDRPATAVIDSVGVRGGDARRSPTLLTVVGDRDHSCSGIWMPVEGPFQNTFFSRCAPDGTVPLIGHAVPSQPGHAFDMAVEVGPPGLGHCWVVGRVTIRYHVGRRHYTAAAAESMTACAGPVNLADPASAPQE
jgi:hypothetical protein